MAAPSGRQPSTSVFIGNVGFAATEEELSTIFKQAGPLKSFRLVTDRETGKAKGYAFAEYYDIPTAQSAQRNLNGADFNGRSLRVDFADSDKYSSDHKGSSQKPTIVGKEAVQAAGQTMAAALGSSGGSGQQQISDALSKMTRPQIFEIMNQMKALIQQNPAQARQILVQNPQLTKALFQAQILLGMVSPPAANGAAISQAQNHPPQQSQQQQQLSAPVHLPPPAQQQSQPQFAPQLQPGFQPGGFSSPAHPQQVQQPQQPAAQQASFPLQQPLPRPQNLPAPLQQAGPGPGPGPRPFSGALSQPLPAPRTLPIPNSGAGPGFPGQPHGMLPQQQSQQQGLPFDPRQAGGSQPRPAMDFRHQQAPHDPRHQPQPLQPGTDPRQHVQDPRLQSTQDPRQPGGAAPRPVQLAPPGQPQPGGMMPGFMQPQPADPRQPQQGLSTGLGPVEQQALLRQVMELTQQQIDMLPEAQRQQVLDLQRQLRGQMGMG